MAISQASYDAARGLISQVPPGSAPFISLQKLISDYQAQLVPPLKPLNVRTEPANSYLPFNPSNPSNPGNLRTTLAGANAGGSGVFPPPVKPAVVSAQKPAVVTGKTGSTGTGTVVTGTTPAVVTPAVVTPPPAASVRPEIPAAVGAVTAVPRATQATAAELAARFGNINYDMNSIKGIFDESTAKEYAAKDKAFRATENTFYNNLANTGMLAQDTLRKNTAQAITTGASRGMQAATELSALLGLQQSGVQGATDLGVQRNLLTEQQQAAMALNTSNALKQATETQLNLGKMSGDIYAADTQFDVGMMSAQAQNDLALKQLQAAGITANANMYGADQNKAGQIGYGSEVARGQIEGSRLSADATKAAAATSAAAATKAAGISAAAYQQPAAAPTLQSLVADAMSKNQPGIAASLIMQATGMSYEEAYKSLGLSMPPATPKIPATITPGSTTTIDKDGYIRVPGLNIDRNGMF